MSSTGFEEVAMWFSIREFILATRFGVSLDFGDLL